MQLCLSQRTEQAGWASPYAPKPQLLAAEIKAQATDRFHIFCLPASCLQGCALLPWCSSRSPEQLSKEPIGASFQGSPLTSRGVAELSTALTTSV